MGKIDVKLLIQFVMFVFLSLFATACSITHKVHEDYSQYLYNNVGRNYLTKTNIDTWYSLSPSTEKHRYEFRSALVGYANLWVVEFGEILDKTMQSKDVKDAFYRIEKYTSVDVDGNLIVFDLLGYSFTDFGAHIEMKVSFVANKKLIFEKIYKSDGKTQGAKMFWGGVFAMKNAIQQSTKLALDEILRNFMVDIVKYSVLR